MEKTEAITDRILTGEGFAVRTEINDGGEASVIFSGEETLAALANLLGELREGDRDGTTYFTLVSAHNLVLRALGANELPVHPDFESGYETFLAAKIA